MTTFGAIRWDAWYSMAVGSPGYELAIAPGPMAPNQWHSRCPVHAGRGDNTITWDDANQNTFDAEIKAAMSMGLDYWVFDHYDPVLQPTMNTALGYYVSSTQHKPRFALMESSGSLGTTGNYATQIALTLTYIQNPNYLFVHGNRPLIYLFYAASNIVANWNSDNANFKVALDALRTSVQSAGFGNPYIVAMPGGVSSNLATVANALGADCVSRYTGPIPTGINTPYTTMTTVAEGFWTTDAAAFSPSIPTCTVGFDPTPWNEKPPSFWTINTNTVIEPTLTELVGHLQRASNFANSSDVPTVLIYSWSECGEGGVALMPTIGDPTASKGAAILKVKGLLTTQPIGLPGRRKKKHRIPVEQLREILRAQGNPWAEELVDVVEAPVRSPKHQEIVEKVVEKISEPIVASVDWGAVVASLQAAQAATRATLAIKHAETALSLFLTDQDDEEVVLLLYG